VGTRRPKNFARGGAAVDFTKEGKEDSDEGGETEAGVSGHSVRRFEKIALMRRSDEGRSFEADCLRAKPLGMTLFFGDRLRHGWSKCPTQAKIGLEWATRSVDCPTQAKRREWATRSAVAPLLLGHYSPALDFAAPRPAHWFSCASERLQID
jgi:hypothetical protein